MHNVLGNDGRSNVEFRNEARRQLEAYGTVKFLDTTVLSIKVNKSDITRRSARFVIGTDGGSRCYASDAVILAAGVSDVPSSTIPGLADAWSAGIIVHCVYCHGYEFRNQPVAAIVLDGDFLTLHGALMSGKLREARDVVVLTNGTAGRIVEGSPSQRSLKKLKALGVRYDDRTIQSVSVQQDRTLFITFVNSSDTIKVSALIHTPHTTLSPTVRKIVLGDLGLSLADSILPGHELIATQDGLGHSDVEGVYICGDLGTVFRSVSGAISSGCLAGTAAHGDMMMAH